MRAFLSQNFYIITEDCFRNESLEYTFAHPQMLMSVPKTLQFFFRKNNIVFLTSCNTVAHIDTYYEGYAYACLYKSSGFPDDNISIDDITLTLICYRYPSALIRHLQERKYSIKKICSGLFDVHKDLMIPTMLICIPDLPVHEYAWITKLTPLAPQSASEQIPVYALNLYKPVHFTNKIRGLFQY